MIEEKSFKARWQGRIVVGSIAMLLAMALTLTACASPAGAPTTSATGSAAGEASQAAAMEVTISIAVQEGSELSEQNAAFVPTEAMTVRLSQGATAFDALMASDAEVTSEESAYGIYVTAIDGLANGSEGPSSGWTYTVNGEMPTESADVHRLASSDEVRWTFVTSFK